MKNNTKLIMETWRRFLKEGPDDLEDPRTYDPYDGQPQGSPVTDDDLSGDEDLEEYNDDPYDPEYNPKGRDPDFGHNPDGRDWSAHESPYYPEGEESFDPSQAYGKDGYNEITDDLDRYGDPAIQTGDAPMLGMSGDDGEDYDDGSSEYVTGEDTLDGMPEDEFYDYSDDSNEY
jgi:hypothetical protein